MKEIKTTDWNIDRSTRPKLRIGEIENEQMILQKGQKVSLINRKKSSNCNEIPLPDENVLRC